VRSQINLGIRIGMLVRGEGLDVATGNGVRRIAMSDAAETQDRRERLTARAHLRVGSLVGRGTVEGAAMSWLARRRAA
jgi:hypothetical protein